MSKLVHEEDIQFVRHSMATDKNGLFQDAEGRTIHMTAGVDHEHAFDQALRQRISDLDWYSHQCLGGSCGSGEDIERFATGDDDATLTNVASTLERLGKESQLLTEFYR